MKIETVTYRKLVSGPGYNNKAVEATAAVEKGETPEDALLGLTAWVHAQLDGTTTMGVRELREEVDFLHRQKQQLRGAVSGAELEVRKLKDEVLALETKRESLGGEPVIPF
jgi:hypothetical protein